MRPSSRALGSRALGSRALVMWVSLAFFFTRVLGQLEALLVAPPWLPRFTAWESGLVPYGLLLPVQIVLIAVMSVLAVDHSRTTGSLRVTSPGTRRVLRGFALLYFTGMLVRLIVTAATGSRTVWDRGLIPILAHWDLALFVLLVAGAGPGRGRRTFRPHGW